MIARALLVAAALAALGGCSGDGPGDGAVTGSDRLSVVRATDAGVVGREALDCAGADRAACDRVAAVLPTLRPAPDEVCAELYGGPERILLSGRLGGEAVALEVGRADGCQIRRYDALAGALAG